MTIEIAPASAHTRPTPAQVWRFRWNITLTLRTVEDSPTGHSRHRYLTATDPDELTEIILRTSYDPRVVSYRYDRLAELDLSLAPTACHACDEPYAQTPPRQALQACDCGGHMTYQCVACGETQMYPDLAITCING